MMFSAVFTHNNNEIWVFSLRHMFFLLLICFYVVDVFKLRNFETFTSSYAFIHDFQCQTARNEAQSILLYDKNGSLTRTEL